MFTTDLNHCQIVRDSLTGSATDEQTLASISILSDRLERIKKTHKTFAGIELSPDVQALAERAATFAVS